MWLYVPIASTSSASAQVEADLTSVSSWQFQALEASAWWRGKPSASRNWFQRCSKVSWLRLLCGAMPEPSTAELGVAQWTASLVASRASLIALPESGLSEKTRATSGQQPGASSCSRVPGSSSSRTSPACSPVEVLSEFTETWADLVLRVRSDCSRRRKSARAMNASAPLSSAWPTPVAQDDNKSPEAHMAMKARMKGGARNTITSLNVLVKAWPTPNALDGEKAPKQFAGGNLSLPETARQWSTPRASDGEKGGPNQSFGAGGMPLPAQTAQWATPAATDGTRGADMARRDTGQPNSNLPTQIAKWSTPSVADVQGGRMTRSKERSDEMLLNGQADALTSSLQDQIIYPVGETSSHPRRSLNPLFVEWLMGWPPGWTLLAWTDFACSATELSRFKQRMRSALSQLASPPAAPPAQLSLLA